MTVPPKRYSLVLSGGSARGAYEAGVLKYIFQTLYSEYGILPHFDIICGTSVGAIHACFLASHIKNIDHQLNRLLEIWKQLKPTTVANLDLIQVYRWKDLLYGGHSSSGLLDTTPLRHLLNEEVDWPGLKSNVKSRFIDNVAISSTSVRNGRTTVFCETNQQLPNSVFRTDFVNTELSSQHVLASASLPLLFPSIQIDGEWFTDGGIRQNTPIAPALAFGATHVFTVGLWHEHKRSNLIQHDDAPSIGTLVGKIFNSFFLDNAQYDLYNLETINDIIKSGEHMFPESTPFTKYRYIETCSINPSENIGLIANDYLSSSKYRHNKIYRTILKMIDVGSIEADLASYLLFDGDFANILIDLGYNDAKQNKYKILDFFGAV